MVNRSSQRRCHLPAGLKLYFNDWRLNEQCFAAPLLTNRSRLTWRTRPNTTSSAPSSSRWSGTLESLARRCWACPAQTSLLTTGACRQGRATVPPTALWPYWPWMLIARKRWGLIDALQQVRATQIYLLSGLYVFNLTNLYVLLTSWPLFLDGWCHWWHY